MRPDQAATYRGLIIKSVTLEDIDVVCAQSLERVLDSSENSLSSV